MRLDPEFRSLMCRIGHHLRLNDGANNLPVDLTPKLKEVHDVLVHASACELDLDSMCIVGEKTVIQCKYTSCNNGKILWRHIYLCSGINCLLCDAMPRIFLFYATQCTDSDCVIPRCSDFKEKIQRRKERKARMNEERLKRLRKKEQELKRLHDMQLSDSEPDASAARKIDKHLGKEKIHSKEKKVSKIGKRLNRLRKKEHDMPMSELELLAAAVRQLSLKEDQGDESCQLSLKEDKGDQSKTISRMAY